MFIGREKELSALNDLYLSEKFEFAVIYGRRRVGKTELIKQFINNKDAIYFTGVENNEKQNLENLTKSIFEFTENIADNVSFSNFQSAFEYVFKVSLQRRIILAIDEYPYVARACPSLPSTLQLLIDKYKDTSKLVLILCGSSMSYMVDNVLAYKSPLYGRRTAQIKLLPFNFDEVRRYLYGISPEEQALIYGAVGGTPQYLMQFDKKISFEDNIKKTYLNPISFLYEEPTNLLKQEVREPATYNAIISAIANGASRLSEISAKIGENTNVCAAYIKNLISLGIIEKENPYGENNSRKTIYFISDNMFRFWYRFVAENISAISKGATDFVYDKIKTFFMNYMGKVFEDISAQYLWRLLLERKCPVKFADLGRWWGNDKVMKCQAEIDIMGVEDKNTALFAECKWTKDKVDATTLETLHHRSKLFAYTNTHLYLFSKSGFTKACEEKALAMGNVNLVEYKDMFSDNG